METQTGEGKEEEERGTQKKRQGSKSKVRENFFLIGTRLGASFTIYYTMTTH